MITVSWFSAGASSAVATKLALGEIDRIIYTHIDDQHPDTMRFLKDCEDWFGRSITILKSHYETVENACRMAGGKGYINGPGGAACTLRLKRQVRIRWEQEHPGPLRYVWGLDYDERNRAERIVEKMPEQDHLFPLIEQKITKERAHELLKASGIKRPAMYDMGYPNNNCIGCVKGGAGYWNKIRDDFPDVFKKRAEMERAIGASMINGTFLDELPEDKGRQLKPIVGDCGIFCEIDKL